ncbi:HAAS signaling domain-containing protein [Paenibacillus sp. CAU 1782]
MELIDRYIFSVTQQLPEKQRADIKRELNSLIADMLEERSQGAVSKGDVESVLLELGHPDALASKYRGQKRYFIGPALFGPYLDTLKVVFISLAIAMTTVLFLDAFASPSDPVDKIINYLGSLYSAGSQGFLWVTLIFAWLQYRQSKNAIGDGENHAEWKPSALPQIPHAKAQIKMREPIINIFLTILFMSLCLYAIDWIGVWTYQDGTRFAIPFFESDVFRHYWPLVWIIGALGILKETLRIIARRRSVKLLAAHAVLAAVSTLLLVMILADAAIWNSGFVDHLVNAGVLFTGTESYDTVSSLWKGVSEWALFAIVIVALIDIGSEAYNTFSTKDAG